MTMTSAAADTMTMTIIMRLRPSDYTYNSHSSPQGKTRSEGKVQTLALHMDMLRFTP
jgi:hypothetical protein